MQWYMYLYCIVFNINFNRAFSWVTLGYSCASIPNKLYAFCYQKIIKCVWFVLNELQFENELSYSHYSKYHLSQNVRIHDVELEFWWSTWFENSVYIQWQMAKGRGRGLFTSKSEIYDTIYQLFIMEWR